MEAICLVAGWLNYNYSEQRKLVPPMKVGNLFYVSDQLPQHQGEVWVDTMNDPSLLYPYKVRSLLWAIETLCSMG